MQQILLNKLSLPLDYMINFAMISLLPSSLSPLWYSYFTNGKNFITSIFLTTNLQICKLTFSKTYVSSMSIPSPFIRQKGPWIISKSCLHYRVSHSIYLIIITGHFTRFAILWLTLPSTISCSVFNPLLPAITRSMSPVFTYWTIVSPGSPCNIVIL